MKYFTKTAAGPAVRYLDKDLLKTILGRDTGGGFVSAEHIHTYKPFIKEPVYKSLESEVKRKGGLILLPRKDQVSERLHKATMRHELTPWMQDKNPGPVQAMQRTGLKLREKNIPGGKLLTNSAHFAEELQAYNAMFPKKLRKQLPAVQRLAVELHIPQTRSAFKSIKDWSAQYDKYFSKLRKLK